MKPARRQTLAKAQYQIVADEGTFYEALESISKHSQIGFDLESNGFFRYPERVCLLQVSTLDSVFIIDPMAVPEVSAFGKILDDPSTETILHAGSHDVVSIDRDWKWKIGRPFDTSIAAAFIGTRRLGLAAVLESVLGVSVSKQKSIQRSDWTRRPLGREWLDYAAQDVKYLLELRETLGERLRELGREQWVIEECDRLARLRHTPIDPDMAVFRVKGWRDLDRRGLAILAALVDYREDHAIRLGKPHFRVIPDAALVRIAAKPEISLSKVRGLGQFARGRLAEDLREAVARGESTEPPRPPQQRANSRLSRDDATIVGRRLAKLKSWRKVQGDRMSLEPSLLWPMKSLQRIARDPDTLPAEIHSPEVRAWQRIEFADALRKALG